MAIEVNGETISNPDIRAEMAALRIECETAGNPLNAEERFSLRDRAIEALIERKLLVQEARRLGFIPTAEQVEQTAALLAPRGDGVSGCRAGADAGQLRCEAERRLMIDALLAFWCAKVAPPKTAEIRDYYRGNRERFHFTEMIHASHLVKNFDGEDRITQRRIMLCLRDRVLAGEDFAALARAESDCPENGGDLGWFARGTMVEEFDDVVFAATPGELTGLFETRFGAHVALVHARRPAGIRELNEVAGSIRSALHRVKMDREVGDRVKALHAKAVIRELA